MKTKAFVITLLFVPAFALAQQASPPAEKVSDGLNAQDVQTLKDAVTTLQDSFAPQTPASGQPATSPAPAKKSMAEVADKVVDLGARAIAQAAGTVQKVAPEVWRIMIRQQYAKAAGLLTVPGGMFLLGVFAWFKTKKVREQDDGDNDTRFMIGYALPLGLMSVFGLWFLNRLADSIMYLFNPEYYAFRDLLIMILNKGQGI